MAQQAGTQILSFARSLSLVTTDGVSDADALVFLNDVLIRFSTNVRQRANILAPSATGLQFAAGDTNKVVTNAINASEFQSAHPTNLTTVTFPLTPELRRVSVRRILELYDYPGDGSAVPTQGGDWECFAAEKLRDQQDDWRVWVFPALNYARNLIVKVPIQATVTALGDTPDIDETDGRYISRLLGWEMARTQKELSADFLNTMLQGIPSDIRDPYMEGAIRALQLYDNVAEVGD